MAHVTTSHLYAVERYDEPGATPTRFPDLPHPFRLAGAVYLPADEVVIAFVEGADEQSVASTVRAAGWRVDRISPAAWLDGRTVR
jgi:hypothetical protein